MNKLDNLLVELTSNTSYVKIVSRLKKNSGIHGQKKPSL